MRGCLAAKDGLLVKVLLKLDILLLPPTECLLLLQLLLQLLQRPLLVVVPVPVEVVEAPPSRLDFCCRGCCRWWCFW